ncbi:type II restriction endonuclease [Myroides odoratimimus]|uniref:type II restriction endonuclease n=1 Tax=Myroides odoratimimus TaxID=76832 RepID=UPI0026DFCF6B|nr:type II restriction endonuclease [Myroides odoratimimus]MDO5858618.1 type II restriction endonuclease [Myroides odoratimimus]
MAKDFKLFLSQLTETNATLDYFTDFKKVRDNVKKISIKLNQLNYLIGKDNLLEAIEDVFDENPKAFEVLDILIAIRKNKKAKTFSQDGEIVLVESYFSSPKMILQYLKETGLAEVFNSKDVTNLVDYVFGIEVGLDTNARKNRGGDNMSKAVSLFFEKANIKYGAEVNNDAFPDVLSFGVDVKRFDFVIKTKQTTFLIETNYYNTGGSKLNEIARAYSDISVKVNEFKGYEFVWITDGQGWNTAKNKLEEAYGVIPNLYNLTTLEEFIKRINLEGNIEF